MPPHLTPWRHPGGSKPLGLDLLLFRTASQLSRRQRTELHIERGDLLARLAETDHALAALASERRTIIDELDLLRDLLWPRQTHLHGRRPPPHHTSPVAPTTARSKPVIGRPLRSACLALLGRHGTQRLVDLHSLLHLHGLEVASPHPVKALADAMGYEAERGRAVRTARGTYALASGWKPRPGRHGDPNHLGPPCGASQPPDDLDYDVDSDLDLDSDASATTGPDPDPDIAVDPDRWWRIDDDLGESHGSSHGGLATIDPAHPAPSSRTCHLTRGPVGPAPPPRASPSSPRIARCRSR